jgi:hypothetical protein
MMGEKERKQVEKKVESRREGEPKKKKKEGEKEGEVRYGNGSVAHQNRSLLCGGLSL